LKGDCGRAIRSESDWIRVSRSRSGVGRLAASQRLSSLLPDLITLNFTVRGEKLILAYRINSHRLLITLVTREIAIGAV
jgi:hypothetical protein